MTIKYTERFNKLWHIYDNALTQGKGKGGKFQALQAFNKYSEDEQDRIIMDTQALMRYFNTQYKPDRLCFLSTWLNQRRFDQEIPSTTTAREEREVKICTVEGCNNETHGKAFKYCAFHIPSNHSDRLKESWVRTGIDYKSPDLVKDCREYCKERMKIIVGKMK